MRPAAPAPERRKRSWWGPACGLPAALMAVVALLAAIGPGRRILRIQTVDALRTEG
ncbi:MAG: ABC transporter permease [Acidobacteriota bacterium]|nr:ABC transporter permease [Acidobacteriota bacterium]